MDGHTEKLLRDLEEVKQLADERWDILMGELSRLGTVYERIERLEREIAADPTLEGKSSSWPRPEPEDLPY